MEFQLPLMSTILAAVVVGLWTYAWLLWCFKATVRHWFVLLLPRRWKGGVSNRLINAMTSSSFSSFLMLDFTGPTWLAHLLNCRYCLSAHIAVVGTLILFTFSSIPLTVAVMAWAGGAGLANYFYKD